MICLLRLNLKEVGDGSRTESEIVALDHHVDATVWTNKTPNIVPIWAKEAEMHQKGWTKQDPLMDFSSDQITNSTVNAFGEVCLLRAFSFFNMNKFVTKLMKLTECP